MPFYLYYNKVVWTKLSRGDFIQIVLAIVVFVNIYQWIFFITSLMDDEKSINLGTVYESVVASELKAHGKNLFYYDNRNNGEVDFLIDDYDSLSTLPLEIKSGKDYTVHSALNRFLSNPDYHVKKGYVLSNERQVYEENDVVYMPIYYSMFF